MSTIGYNVLAGFTLFAFYFTAIPVVLALFAGGVFLHICCEIWIRFGFWNIAMVLVGLSLIVLVFIA